MHSIGNGISSRALNQGIKALSEAHHFRAILSTHSSVRKSPFSWSLASPFSRSQQVRSQVVRHRGGYSDRQEIPLPIYDRRLNPFNRVH